MSTAWIGCLLQRVECRECRRRAGHEPDPLRQGLEAADVKPMPTVGAAIYELRIRAVSAFRVFHVARFAEAIFVLHACQKMTQQTARLDLELGAKRYRDLIKQLLGEADTALRASVRSKSRAA